MQKEQEDTRIREEVEEREQEETRIREEVEEREEREAAKGREEEEEEEAERMRDVRRQRGAGASASSYVSMAQMHGQFGAWEGGSEGAGDTAGAATGPSPGHTGEAPMRKDETGRKGGAGQRHHRAARARGAARGGHDSSSEDSTPRRRRGRGAVAEINAVRARARKGGDDGAQGNGNEALAEIDAMYDAIDASIGAGVGGRGLASAAPSAAPSVGGGSEKAGGMAGSGTAGSELGGQSGTSPAREKEVCCGPPDPHPTSHPEPELTMSLTSSLAPLGSCTGADPSSRLCSSASGLKGFLTRLGLGLGLGLGVESSLL